MKAKPKRFKAKDATKPLEFEILAEHVAAASCGDPEQCVVAQAVRAHCGDLFDVIQVGATVTKLTRADGIKVRYRTGAILRRALIQFDLTGKWNLPAGIYKLKPPGPGHRLTDQPNNLHKMTAKQKASPKKGRKRRKNHNTPTRKVARVNSIIPTEAGAA